MVTSRDHTPDAQEALAGRQEKGEPVKKGKVVSKGSRANRGATAGKTKKLAGRKRPARKTNGRRSGAKKRSAASKKGLADSGSPEEGPNAVSRKELLEKAFERLKMQLESEQGLNATTINALEKLLKLDRDIVEEEEVPNEIRVLWHEINGESSSGE